MVSANALATLRSKHVKIHCGSRDEPHKEAGCTSAVAALGPEFAKTRLQSGGVHIRPDMTNPARQLHRALRAAAQAARIAKHVSPHTLRQRFVMHMLKFQSVGRRDPSIGVAVSATSMLAEREYFPSLCERRFSDHGGSRKAEAEIYRASRQETQESTAMDTNTLLIILVVILLFGGFGFYGRGRWF